MKKTFITSITLLALLCLGGVAVAEEAPTPQADATVNAQVVEAAPAHAESACNTNEIQLSGMDQLLEDMTANACSCLDLCSSDAECALRNGPGSTCEPQGPCDCKECVSTS